MINFEDGTVLLDAEEMDKLNDFGDKVGRLMNQYATLVKQHEQLKHLHQYAILVRDSFEVENAKLRTQIKADQYAAFHRAVVMDNDFRAGL
jgi:regulator of replication initiation timing